MKWFYWSALSAVSTALLVVLSSIGLRGVDALSAVTLRAFFLFIILSPIWTWYYYKVNVDSLFGADFKYWSFAVAAGLVGVLSWYSYYKALGVALDERISAATVTAVNYTSVALIALALPFQNRIEIYLGASADKLPALRPMNWIGIGLVIVGAYLASQRHPSTVPA